MRKLLSRRNFLLGSVYAAVALPLFTSGADAEMSTFGELLDSRFKNIFNDCYLTDMDFWWSCYLTDIGGTTSRSSALDAKNDGEAA